MSLFNPPLVRATDSNGNPLAGAKLFFYRTGTTELVDVYTNQYRTTEHTNPVIADAGGLFPFIHLNPLVTYRAILKTAANVTIQDADPVNSDFSMGVASITAYGALGDGSTDNASAIDEAVDFLRSTMGGTLYVPSGRFYTTQKQTFDTCIRIHGEISGENPGTVSGVSYPYPTYFYGSVLEYAAGVSAFEFQPFTSEESVATVTANISAYFTNPSAYNSTVENLTIVSRGNGAVAAGKYGIRSRTRINLRNLWVLGFGEDGVLIEATSDTPDGNVYGNANLSFIENVRSENNARHGVFIRGRDTNAMQITTPDCRNNGGWGLNMESLLSNSVTGGHFDSNNRLLAADADSAVGSIRTTSAVGLHCITGVYIEGFGGRKTSLSAATTFIGGHGAATDIHPSTSPAFILNAGQAIRKPISGLNNLGATEVTAGLGRDPQGTSNVALWFGSADDTATQDAYKLVKNHQWTGIWALTYANSPMVEEYVTGDHAASALVNGYAKGFPNGIYLGTANSAPRLLPSAAAAPGTIVGYRRGDVIYNSLPASGSPVGWMCGAAAWLPMANLP